MNNIDQIVFSLFGKKNLSECDVDELRKFRDSYPFYTPAHFLYTKKLREGGDDETAAKEFNRSSIHYHNSLLVDFLLSERSLKKPTMMQQDPAPLKAQPEEDPFNDEIVYANRHDADEKTNGVTPVQETRAAEIKPAHDLAFEPFHTVDYFASQGIKNIIEEKPKDRFGQQLKSFTDWLKTMKRLPESEIAKAIPAVSEEKVITMAEHSIENRDVITESMADVWIKQGHPEKAIEIYEKLSLLNPSKSVYFAGLIENLKGKK